MALRTQNEGVLPGGKESTFYHIVAVDGERSNLFDEPTNSDDDRLAKDEDEEKSLIPNFCGFEDRAYNPFGLRHRHRIVGGGGGLVSGSRSLSRSNRLDMRRKS